LIIVHLQKIEVDCCPACRGFWLDAGELEQLLTRTGAHADEAFLTALDMGDRAATPTTLLCPRCDQPMTEMRYADLMLDRCAQGHGLWFDRDELPRLLGRLPPDAGAARTIACLNELFVKPASGGN
jgi:Zn-finger nucleic acid-binding protein